MKRLVALLKPDVSPEAKITGVSLFVGKWLDHLDRRLTAIETTPPVNKTIMVETKSSKLDSVGALDAVDRRLARLEVQQQENVVKQSPVAVETVVGADVELDGHLIIRMSSGRIIDAGKIDSPSNRVIATSSNRDQIIISATQPTSPQINDLWVQI